MRAAAAAIVHHVYASGMITQGAAAFAAPLEKNIQGVYVTVQHHSVSL